MSESEIKRLKAQATFYREYAKNLEEVVIKLQASLALAVKTLES